MSLLERFTLLYSKLCEKGAFFKTNSSNFMLNIHKIYMFSFYKGLDYCNVFQTLLLKPICEQRFILLRAVAMHLRRKG